MCARIQSLSRVHEDVLTRYADYCCVHVPRFTADGVTGPASATSITRSSAPVLSVTKRNFGPPLPVKSRMPSALVVPAVHVPTAVRRVWTLPLRIPSESSVGAPEPLNERYPTKTPGAPGVASVSGRTSAASKAQVKLVGQTFVGIVTAKAFPQRNTAPIKTTISENRFIPTLCPGPI